MPKVAKHAEECTLGSERFLLYGKRFLLNFFVDAFLVLTYLLCTQPGKHFKHVCLQLQFASNIIQLDLHTKLRSAMSDYLAFRRCFNLLDQLCYFKLLQLEISFWHTSIKQNDYEARARHSFSYLAPRAQSNIYMLGYRLMKRAMGEIMSNVCECIPLDPSVQLRKSSYNLST